MLSRVIVFESVKNVFWTTSRRLLVTLSALDGAATSHLETYGVSHVEGKDYVGMISCKQGLSTNGDSNPLAIDRILSVLIRVESVQLNGRMLGEKNTYPSRWLVRSKSYIQIQKHLL